MPFWTHFFSAAVSPWGHGLGWPLASVPLVGGLGGCCWVLEQVVLLGKDVPRVTGDLASLVEPTKMPVT